MEPMTLGGPTPPSASSSNNYLPSFLLGEINPPTTPRPNSLSPIKGHSVASGSPFRPLQSSTPKQRNYRQNVSMHQQVLYNQQMNNMLASPNISYSSSGLDDLFDTIKSNESSINKSLFQDSYTAYNNNSSMNMYGNNENTLMYNQAINGQWQDECQEHDEYWVTVFGFPPNAANTVLMRFSNCGAILDKQYPTQGNWAHIRFSTRAEKERALALNREKVLPGVMIGVVDCEQPPRIAASPASPERHSWNVQSLCPTPMPNTPLPQRSRTGPESLNMSCEGDE